MKNTAYINTVLIIENNELARFGLKSALEKRLDFAEILEAATKEKALDLSEKHSPNLVIMDICQPDSSGIELIKKLKNLNKNVKIIILTSQKNEDNVLEAIHAGANAYCMKDINAQKLLNIIETVQEGAIWFDPAVSEIVLNILNKDQKNKKYSKAPDKIAKLKNEKARLTQRETDVLRLIVNGCNNAEISEKLCVSIHTAKAHVCNILHKLKVEDRTQAAILALKHKIIQ